MDRKKADSSEKIKGLPVKKSEMAAAYGLSKARVAEIEALVLSVVKSKESSAKRKKAVVRPVLEETAS